MEKGFSIYKEFIDRASPKNNSCINHFKTKNFIR